MALSPEQRSIRASIGGHTRAGKHDPQVLARSGQAGLLGRFLAEVDEQFPDLDDTERLRRAGQLRKAHMRRLALISSKARRKAGSS